MATYLLEDLTDEDYQFPATCGQCNFFRENEKVYLPNMGINIQVPSHCGLAAILNIQPAFRKGNDEPCAAYVEDCPF